MSQNQRRRFLIAAFLLLAGPLTAHAQVGKIHRVAYIDYPTSEGQEAFKIFRAAMRELGYAEGRNIVYDTRIADRDMRQVPVLVDELIASRPDVLLGSKSIAQAMRKKSTSIPIVLTNALDPVTSFPRFS
jgi:putative ABC transport system substrate-binding protein